MDPDRRVVYAEFAEERRDKGSILVVMPGGLEVLIPPAECWPDAAFTVRGPNVPTMLQKMYRTILGKEVYDQFIKQGGTIAMLDKIVESFNGDDKPGGFNQAK